ncbi:hypothetical protein ACF3DV_19660 [Chlorogloeopsis fritschii PCC 9212]|nr:hypothetical protein [Chlorogloeopsis fritschii]
MNNKFTLGKLYKIATTGGDSLGYWFYHGLYLNVGMGEKQSEGKFIQDGTPFHLFHSDIAPDIEIRVPVPAMAALEITQR